MRKKSFGAKIQSIFCKNPKNFRPFKCEKSDLSNKTERKTKVSKSFKKQIKVSASTTKTLKETQIELKKKNKFSKSRRISKPEATTERFCKSG
mgnify:CR=1 FL=1